MPCLKSPAACVSTILALLFLASPSSWAEVPPECLDIYIESGAIPVGPNATWQELRSCEISAATGPVDLGTYYCIGTGSSEWITEYCGTICPDHLSIEECFSGPGEPLPTPNTGSPECPSEPGAGNPILISTGNKFQRETDQIVYGPFPLSIVRYYNSALKGWRYGGIHHLDITTDQIQWSRDDGKGLTFLQRNGHWRIADRPAISLVETTSGNWRLQDRDNLRYTFDANGVLLDITDLAGWRHDYHYSGAGQLQRISHSNGSELVFGYDASGRVSSARINNSGLHQYHYANGQLISVTDPDGRVRQYLYEDSRFPMALTGIIDQRGIRFASWQYDDEGRAIRSEHGEGIDVTTLAFNGDGTTTVTNALGKSTTYHVTEINGAYKVTLVEGHASAQCSAANHAYSYYPDDDPQAGLLATQTDWDGNVTRYEYNERGLVVRTIEAEGSAEERITTTQWHAEFNLPAQITEPGRVIDYSYDTRGQLLSTIVTRTDAAP